MQPPMSSFLGAHMGGDDTMQRQGNDRMTMQFPINSQQQQQQQSRESSYTPTYYYPQLQNNQYHQQHHHHQGYPHQYQQTHHSNAVLLSAGPQHLAPHHINSHRGSSSPYQSISPMPLVMDLPVASTPISYSFGASDPLAVIPRTVDEQTLLAAATLSTPMPIYSVVTDTTLPATTSQGLLSAFTASQYQQPIHSPIADSILSFYSASPTFPSTSTGLVATPVLAASPFELQTFPAPISAPEVYTPEPPFGLPPYSGPDHDPAGLGASLWDRSSLDCVSPGSGVDPTQAVSFRSPVDVSAKPSPLAPPKRKRSAKAEDEHGYKKVKRESVSNGLDMNDQGQTHIPGDVSAQAFYCTDCHCPPFASQKALDKHVTKIHGRYPCIFSFAEGCQRRFSKKNEWKRHCMTQHIVQEYYICSSEQCSGKSDAAFLRKDLFTAHLDRVHTPKHIMKEHRERRVQKAQKAQKAGSDSKARKKGVGRADRKKAGSASAAAAAAAPLPHATCSQECRDVCRDRDQLMKDSRRARARLPVDIACRLPGCGSTFSGSNAWCAYLAHVAKHLDCLSPETQDFCFGAALAEYAMDIGILRVKDGSEPRQYELVPVTVDTVVHPKYRP